MAELQKEERAAELAAQAVELAASGRHEVWIVFENLQTELTDGRMALELYERQLR